MTVAVIGLGRMGSAFAERLLSAGHGVSVWNRTAGRAAPLEERGARIMGTADDIGDDCDAIFLCLADDHSTLEVAAPQGDARPRWAQPLVVNTGTVAPEVVTVLARTYGDRFVDTPILGAPQAVRSGAASFIVGGPAPARAALAPIWKSFAGAHDVGDRPETAACVKLLNNQMLLVQLAAIAETVRAGRAAGIDDATSAEILRGSPMVAPALRNRIDVLFDPDHVGWFTSAQAAKDVALALGLTEGEPPLPVTEAARDAYRRVAQDGNTQDAAAVVEYGRRPP